MTYSVRKITDPRDLNQISRWMYRWWGHSEGYSPEAVRSAMARSLQNDHLPQTYGLFLGDTLIGMYQFTQSDLFVRPDLYPWLANVYLDPDYRGKGYGHLLLSTVRENAMQLDADALYLYTTCEGLYEKYGWQFMELTDTFLEPRMQRLYRLSLR